MWQLDVSFAVVLAILDELELDRWVLVLQLNLLRLFFLVGCCHWRVCSTIVRLLVLLAHRMVMCLILEVGATLEFLLCRFAEQAPIKRIVVVLLRQAA